MTLYELLRKISSVLAKNNADKLFEYMVHSMDDDGHFLRSRYCYWDKPLPNLKCGNNLKTILVTLRRPFDFCNSTEFYEESDYPDTPFTLLKMQIFIYDLSDKNCLKEEAMWSYEMGYKYQIKIDLVNESLEFLSPISYYDKTKI